MSNVAVYMRVSTHDQTLASQRHAIDEWLLQKYASDSVTYYEEQGLSGKLDARPQFQRLIADVKAGKVDTVVVYRLDRLSRNATTALSLLLDWMQAGVAFFAVDQPVLQLGKDNPLRLTIVALFSELAQLEREAIVSRVRAGLAAARAKGVKLGAAPKLLDAQVTHARMMQAGGASYRQIARELQVSPSTAYRICNT